MPGLDFNLHDPINVKSKMTDDLSRPHALEPTLPLANGLPPKPARNDIHPPAINGAPSKPIGEPMLPKDLKAAMQQLAPELPNLIHVTEGYQPLSVLLERAAQQCFNGLKETIANTQDTPGSGMVNGSANGVNNDSNSASKRLKWLQFANTNRERFIKILVLLQWSKQARSDIGQLVDVVSWMRQMTDSYNDVEDKLGLFKREISGTKVPRPDIDTALEVLTTGQSSGMPDLGYLPRPPISARKVLDTFKNINTLLHVRLNVYEHLPPQLRNFRIASGRVTFIAPTEFELDLSIFDEDPKTHFYFLDIRFLFSPSSEIPTGPLRDELELRANAILASEGLAACYEFFHDFTLTYKISILRRQVVDLARAAWTGTIRVERVHRSLVIQYWIGSKQKKSWVEIGIKSGERRSGSNSWKGDVQSQIFIKWVRAGKDVSAEDPTSLDHQNINVEPILDNVIRRHIRHLIGSVKNKFASALGASSSWRNNFTSHEDHESDPFLTMPLYFNRFSTLRIEPFSGTFSLSPRTSSSTRCESSLNKLHKPEEELFAKLQAWRALDGSATFRASVARFGWEVLKPIQLEASARKQYFGDSSVGQSFIKCWADPRWVIAATPNPLLSFSLWILNVEEPKQNLWRADGLQVRNAFKVDSDASKLSTDYFSRLCQLSVATISSHLTRSRLSELRMSFVPQVSETEPSNSAFPILSLDVSSIIAPSKIANRLLLGYYGREQKVSPSPKIIHVARGFLDGTERSRSLMTPIKSPGVAFRSDGTFIIVDRSPAFTTQVVDNILRMLRHIAQLQSCLENLERYQFRIMSVNLGSLTFTYSYAPHLLQARLLWSDNGSVSLALAPRDNPHRRLLPVFRNSLQPSTTSPIQASRVTSVFAAFARSLHLTLNLLNGFDAVELKREATVEVDRLDKYKIVYERPSCSLMVTLRQDQERSWWYIEQAEYSPRTNSKLQAELKSVMSESSEGIMGINKGVAVDPEIVDKFLGQLDERIRACADGEEKRAKKPKIENSTGKPPQPEAPAPPSAKKEKAQGKGQQPKKQPPTQSKSANGTANRWAGNGAKGNKPEVVVLD